MKLPEGWKLSSANAVDHFSIWRNEPHGIVEVVIRRTGGYAKTTTTTVSIGVHGEDVPNEAVAFCLVQVGVIDDHLPKLKRRS